MADDVVSPLRGEPIFDETGQFTLRYSEFFDKTAQAIEDLGGSVDDVDSVTGIVSRQNALIANLAARISDLEANDKSSILTGKIAKVNARIDELIALLLEELKLLRPDIELEEKKASLLQAVVKQLELLNARTEEAYETTIEEEET